MPVIFFETMFVEVIMRRVSSICVYCVFGLLFWGCSSTTESKTVVDHQRENMQPIVTPTEKSENTRQASDATELCKQLAEIKSFPGRDPSEEQDPIYAAVMLKGKELMPCLVEEISNEIPMHDPRSAPIWEHYVVGDTAVFLLTDLAQNDELLVQMLPLKYREEWETNGVYAYFNYVSVTKNRHELKEWWRTWLARQNSKPRATPSSN